TVVAARVQTQDASFRLPGTGLSWSGITTDLTYHTENGFSGGPVQARFMEQPVSVRFRQTGQGDALSIRQSGQLPLPAFLHQMGLAGSCSLGQDGTLDYTAGLTVAVEGASTVSVYSGVTGLTVEWPVPEGKTSTET